MIELYLVWEKATKGRAGILWDSVVDKARTDIGAYQEGLMSVDTFGRYRTEVENIMGEEAKASAEKYG